MKPGNQNSYNSLKTISINDRDYKYYSLAEAEKNGLDGISKLPKSLKVLLENLLRYEDDLVSPTLGRLQVVVFLKVLLLLQIGQLQLQQVIIS